MGASREGALRCVKRDQNDSMEENDEIRLIPDS